LVTFPISVAAWLALTFLVVIARGIEILMLRPYSFFAGLAEAIAPRPESQ
jgi:hypothetical protein